MRAAIFLSAFLCASSAAASAAIDAFKRVDRVLESRAAARNIAPAHSHERLQKRASPYLNNATQSEYIICLISRPAADWTLEFVVDGTKIPDVDVCWKRDDMVLQAYKNTVRYRRVLCWIGSNIIRRQRDAEALLLVFLNQEDALYSCCAYH